MIAADYRTFIQQADDRHLVRHRHQRAVEIREFPERREDAGKVLGPDPHRHDDGVDPVLLEPRVVDQWCLERLGRVSDVGDESGLAADHGSLVPCVRGGGGSGVRTFRRRGSGG